MKTNKQTNKQSKILISTLLTASIFVSTFEASASEEKLNLDQYNQSKIQISEIKPSIVGEEAISQNITVQKDKSDENSVLENTDLYTCEGVESFVGYPFEIYSHSNSITKDSTITYKREDGSKVTFKATKENSRNGEYYFLVLTDTRGIWTVDSFNDQKIKDEKLKVMTYRDMQDFDEINNKGLDRSSMYKIRVKRSLRNIYRHEGSSRIETAINISKSDFNRANNVIVVNGWKQVDAIAATALATDLNAPILYTGSSSLDTNTKREIQRLRARTVYMIGGENSITNNVRSQLFKTGRVSQVQRISGSDRSQTALELAKEAAKYKKGRSAIVVSGKSESDCLAMSAISGENGSLMFYSINGRLDSKSKQFIKSNFSCVFTINGDDNISSSTTRELKNMGLKVIPKYGNDSYDLSIKLSRDTMFYNSINDVYLTSGRNSADGIPGSVLAAKKGVPLILVNGDRNKNEIKDYINDKNVDNVFILGGTSSVSKTLENTLRSNDGSSSSISRKRQQIIELAKQQLGKPYIYGATGPNSFDCSGLVQYVYKNAIGMNVPRNSVSQSKYGRGISKSDLKPGDIVYWSSPYGHVAIYIGDNKVIHAPDENQVVKISTLWGNPSAYRSFLD